MAGMRRVLSALTVLAPAVAGAACGQEGPAATLVATGGAVAAGTPEAVEAGERILLLGGNAADAAVAISLALAVSEPGQSGLGGSAVALVRAPGSDPVILHAPASPLRGPTDGAGPLAATPALLPVLERLWRRYGSGNLTWEQLVEPAAALAESGFRLGRLSHRTLVQEYPRLLADTVLVGLFLTESRAIPAEGTVLTRPALAATLRRIARQGAGDLYRGELANRLLAWADASRSVTLGRSDLANAPAPEELAAARGSFRGWTVWTAPEPFAGPEVLEALRFLEAAPAAVWESSAETRIPWISEALARAFFGNGSAGPAIGPGGIPPLPVPMADTMTDTSAGGPAASPRPSDALHETTHFSVMDRDGMSVALTQSLGGPFGAALPAGDLGFVLARPGGGGMEEVPGVEPGNTAGAGQGSEGDAADRRVAGSADGKRWMAPTLVEGSDSLALLLGSPGGPRGVSAVVQVVVAWTHRPEALQEAISAPRLHVGPSPGSSRGRLYLEGLQAEPADSILLRAAAPWSDSLRAALAARGFLPTERDTGLLFEGLSPWFGGVNAVARMTGEWLAAADPRRDGVGRRVGDGGAARTIPVTPRGDARGPRPPGP